LPLYFDNFAVRHCEAMLDRESKTLLLKLYQNKNAYTTLSSYLGKILCCLGIVIRLRQTKKARFRAFLFGGEKGILRFACGPLVLRTARPLGGAARGGQTVHRTLCFSALRIPPSIAK